MAKKKAHVFTQAEIFYITEKTKGGETAEQIAEVIGCTVDEVKPHMPTLQTQNSETHMYRLMGRDKHHRSVVSTPAASELSDSIRSTIRHNGQSVDCIHQCRPKKS